MKREKSEKYKRLIAGLFVLEKTILFCLMFGPSVPTYVRNKRKQIYRVYAWLIVGYFRIWHIVLLLLLIALLYKIVRDRKLRQVPG